FSLQRGRGRSFRGALPRRWHHFRVTAGGMGKRGTDRGSGRRWSAAAAIAALTFLARPLAAQDDTARRAQDESARRAQDESARRFAMFDGVSLVEDPAQPTPQSGFSLGLEEARQEKVRQEEAKHAPEPVRPPGRRRFFTAASEVALLELLPWAFDRYIGKYDYAYISTETVRRNFRRGFGYDPDTFVVNQSSHPYHGSLFFNAARENGYSFWESSVFTLMGSLIWECCMENTRPST